MSVGHVIGAHSMPVRPFQPQAQQQTQVQQQSPQVGHDTGAAAAKAKETAQLSSGGQGHVLNTLA